MKNNDNNWNNSCDSCLFADRLSYPIVFVV